MSRRFYRDFIDGMNYIRLFNLNIGWPIAKMIFRIPSPPGMEKRIRHGGDKLFARLRGVGRKTRSRQRLGRKRKAW